MIPATQLRSGTLIIYNGELHRVHDVIHKTPGNLRGFVQAKMRNLRSGAMNEHRFGSTDRVEKASLDEREMEYLYSDAAGHHFMDQESYDQVALSDEVIGEQMAYLLPLAGEGHYAELVAHYQDDDGPAREYVVESFRLKGDSNNADINHAFEFHPMKNLYQKPAYYSIRIKIDTRDNSYLERA